MIKIVIFFALNSRLCRAAARVLISGDVDGDGDGDGDGKSSTRPHHNYIGCMAINHGFESYTCSIKENEQ